MHEVVEPREVQGPHRTPATDPEPAEHDHGEHLEALVHAKRRRTRGRPGTGRRPRDARQKS